MALQQPPAQATWASVPLTARPLLKQLQQLRFGRLKVQFDNGALQSLVGTMDGPSAELVLHRPLSLVARLVARGDIGFAEGYVAGDWDSPDLAATLSWGALNEQALAQVTRGSRLSRALDRLRHVLRPNNRRGSRRNIARHYDLGNDFYALWLDETMSYSSALFDSVHHELAAAQRRKYTRLLDSLEARPGQHILEIGCGWGGFAEQAARRGMRVTGVTLSQQQLRYARARIKRLGLEDRVELRLQDYRDVHETYDHIVSIEMFEAVGERYWPTYFETLHTRLKPGGRAAIQVITIGEDFFQAYRSQADFIQLYIFPGGMLPTVGEFQELARSVGLGVGSIELFGPDYAETLHRWDNSFAAHGKQLAELGYDRRFQRLWHYYLAYCEAGFRTGRIDLMQTVLQRS
ncbi:MAG: cyclopropane-fatty-acyl-phospholipid synthase [Thiotrichales bacterium SG8_50]|nr:MAG: cyclopropane-fatty-acyl-phospholipid synthase [Thiotrichales bacterium SG8_50]